MWERESSHFTEYRLLPIHYPTCIHNVGKIKQKLLTPHLVRVGLSGKIVSILLQLLMVQQLMASLALGAKCDWDLLKELRFSLGIKSRQVWDVRMLFSYKCATASGSRHLSSRYLAPLGKIPQGLWRIFIKYVERLSIQITLQLSCSLEVFPHSSL